MDQYQNKYRISSARAQWWDYGWNGAYFVTICTHNRKHFFGEIVHGRFIASTAGKLAELFWHEIPTRFSSAELGDFVVMPNHIHGILILNRPCDIHEDKRADPVIKPATAQSGGDWPTDTQQTTNPNMAGGFARNKNPMLYDNLSHIIRWYKGRCSFEIRKLDTAFAWQSRFHEHIIRHDGEYQRISDYIVTNPGNWSNDCFYSV